MKFIGMLEKMGCEVRWDKGKENNLWLKGPDGKLKGIEVKMSDFSDQALTLAAIAPFADSKVTITGIAHIRGQESDRIKVIVDELTKMGISCNELTDGVEIYPGTPKNVEIETYNDHRVAMSFAVTGLAGDGMTILNPECCKKTFAGFFDEIDCRKNSVPLLRKQVMIRSMRKSVFQTDLTFASISVMVLLRQLRSITKHLFRWQTKLLNY